MSGPVTDITSVAVQAEMHWRRYVSSRAPADLDTAIRLYDLVLPERAELVPKQVRDALIAAYEPDSDGVTERASYAADLIAVARRITTAFDGVFTASGMRVIKTPVRAPRANSFAERFVGTLRRECLAHILILGEGHLRQVLAEFARHYNEHRPHQSLRQDPPWPVGRSADFSARIERRQVLGSLISEYRRTA